MKNKDLACGIDTSNYKTSVAIVDREGHILFNHQQLLTVKPGQRGLRQSEALFQHVQNLPPVIEAALADRTLLRRIGAVAASDRPRPIEGSYMPVFTVGTGYGKAVASALGLRLQTFSHQEGHVEAVRYFSMMRDVNRLICFHFSGGTTEALLAEGGSLRIVGGSRDLAYGQVLDRIGVAMGMPFPAGEALDHLAMTAGEPAQKKQLFTTIKVRDGFVNLSGTESQGQRLLPEQPQSAVAQALFAVLARSITEMTMQLSVKYQVSDFLYAGGVSCSQYIRKYLQAHVGSSLRLAFGTPQLSSDNAVGIALLGGKELWR